MLPRCDGVLPQVGLYQKLNLKPSDCGPVVTVKTFACPHRAPLRAARHWRHRPHAASSPRRPRAPTMRSHAVIAASLGQALDGVVIGARGSGLRRGLCVVEKTVDHGKGCGCVFAHLGGESSPEIVPGQPDASLPLDLFVKPLPRRERLAGSGQRDEQGIGAGAWSTRFRTMAAAVPTNGMTNVLLFLVFDPSSRSSTFCPSKTNRWP